MKLFNQTLSGKCIYSVEDKETSTPYIIFYQGFFHIEFRNTRHTQVDQENL